MRAEINHNEMNMDTATEQGGQHPPEYAVKQLAKQLDIEHLSTARSAADAIHKAALNSDDPLVRIEGIRVLSKFASIQPHSVDPSRQESLRLAQARARDKIAAIAFGSEADVRLQAVLELGMGLGIPALDSEKHTNIIQLIAIIGASTPDNNVKNEAIAALSAYASRRDAGGGYEGQLTYPESQAYANRVIGVVSRPAAPEVPAQTPAPAAVLPPGNQ